MISKTTGLICFLIATSYVCDAQIVEQYDAIHSGVPKFDRKGKVVSVHGANIVKENGTFYLFGEAHSDTSNAFVGFNCYSSTDLYNWNFESIALPLQDTGRLGPDRVGERPKVMRSPKTGEYVMFMHTDNLAYKDQGIGYATSNKITGPYVYRGLLLFDGKPIKKWDMGTFQDKDGSGYLLIHGGFIYKLSDDYRSISALVNNQIARGFESPAMFRRRNVYYFLGSHLTGWERNDNDYYTATSLSGPWTLRGTFAPEGTLTWNSQTTFVLPIEGSKDTTFMFMGDRWSFPKQASAATYVWQPLTVDDTSISLPEFHDAWSVNLATGQVSIVNKEKKTIGNTDKSIRYTGRWEHPSDTATLASSNEKGASFSVKLKGRQFSLYSMARPDGGYAFITLQNSKGKTVLSSTVDMYCKYPLSTLKFVTPILPEGNYKLTVSVMGERWYWIDKRQNRSGSSGDFISLDKIVINQ